MSTTRKKNRYDIPVTVRLPEDMIADLDELAASETERTRNPTKRADALRMALGHGIKIMKEKR